MKIGILSDTHGTLSDFFTETLKTCDYVIHAGDFGSASCYQKIKDLNIPMYMVRGNCDFGDWSSYLPYTLAFHIDGIRFYLLHNLANLPYDISDSNTDIVISGHSHIAAKSSYQNLLYLNPGSASRSRGSMGNSIALLETEEGKPGYSITFITPSSHA